MKHSGLAIFLLAGSILLGVSQAAAQTGTVKFTVHITPSSGVAEPVRGLPFYLLRKSFVEIGKEADAAFAKPDFATFVKNLKESKELKAWMMAHHTVVLNGEAFVSRLTPDDILGIPEFWDAYLTRNVSNTHYGFPAPKFKEADRTKNPAKYQREMQVYRSAVRKYLLIHPESTEGIDLSLEPYDESQVWEDKLAARARDVHRLKMDMAQSKYAIAQAQTDLNGTAGFAGVAPGTYWLSTLGIEGEVGDTHEAWDAPVTVRAGEVTQVMLSNFNATTPKTSP